MYVYLIENKVNGKKYVGSHMLYKNGVLKKLDYWGSGVEIQKAVKQEGKRCFSKRVLKWFTDEFEMRDVESRYIQAEVEKGTELYNVSMWANCTTHKWELVPGKREEVNKKISERLRKAHTDPEYRKRASEKAIAHWKSLSDEQKQTHVDKIREGQLNSVNYPPVSVNYSRGVEHSRKVKEGLKHSTHRKREYREAWNKGLKGLPSSGISKKVEIDGVMYESINKAAKAMGVSRLEIEYRAGLKSRPVDPHKRSTETQRKTANLKTAKRKQLYYEYKKQSPEITWNTWQKTIFSEWVKEQKKLGNREWWEKEKGLEIEPL